MILLGGSEGGDSMASMAAFFARHGYVATSVAYFGLPGLPRYLVNIPVETIHPAIEALVRRGDVDPRRIGILGGSKGGEFVLLVASTYPQIHAVVADVPSPFGWMGLGAGDEPSGCSWSRHGKPLPCVPPSARANRELGTEYMLHLPVVLRKLYNASMRAHPDAVRAAFFPLQRIAGPVLCLSGTDDQMWDSRKQCAMAMNYLHQHKHPYADRAISYADAGHAFLWARFMPPRETTSYRVGGVTMKLGGTPQGNAAASMAGWKTIFAFLQRTLGAQR
ncbi:MAG: acyl-CoA thioester hydrolase/BAAT C-terminal domain-containing protein [Vulcanimicrobiaceae bacterium]